MKIYDSIIHQIDEIAANQPERGTKSNIAEVAQEIAKNAVLQLVYINRIKYIVSGGIYPLDVLESEIVYYLWCCGISDTEIDVCVSSMGEDDLGDTRTIIVINGLN